MGFLGRSVSINVFYLVLQSSFLFKICFVHRLIILLCDHDLIFPFETLRLANKIAPTVVSFPYS